MKYRIKERLDLGEHVELECIDSIGFIEKSIDNKLILELENLIVERYQDWSCDYRTGVYLVRSEYESQQLGIRPEDAFIPVEDLKYFKIKEPTFNDLIEVAKKAVQDDILSSFTVNDMGYSDFIGRAIYIGLGMRAHRIANEIKRIQSLYTETFVIESESDIKKTKEGASVELANGNVFIVNKSKHESLAMKDGSKATGLTFKDSNNFWITYSLFELKGATVTQEVSK